MNTSELARLQAIESAARAYVEWSSTCPDEPTGSWFDRAVFLRGVLQDALEAKP